MKSVNDCEIKKSKHITGGLYNVDEHAYAVCSYLFHFAEILRPFSFVTEKTFV